MPPIADILLFAVMLAAAGAVAGLLAGVFGIGGGAVLVPVFYQVFGYAGIPEEVIMHLAVGTSTALIVPTSIRSYRAHRVRGAVDVDLLKRWVVAVPLGRAWVRAPEAMLACMAATASARASRIQSCMAGSARTASM